MNALIPTVEAAHAAPAELTQVDFTPTPKDWLFLQAVQDAIDKEGKADCAAIGRQLGQSKQNVWKRLQNEKFRAWVNQEMQRAADDLWSRIVYKAATLAIRGSEPHMTFFAKVRGGFKQPDGEPLGGAVPVQVNILIPRPRR